MSVFESSLSSDRLTPMLQKCFKLKHQNYEVARQTVTTCVTHLVVSWCANWNRASGLKKKHKHDRAALVRAEKSPDRRENLTLPEKLRRSINTNNQFFKKVSFSTPNYDSKIMTFNISITFDMVRRPNKRWNMSIFTVCSCRSAFWHDALFW